MKTLILYIVIATLLAGILDICFAFANAWATSGTSPAAVLRYVASGLYGQKAFSGNGFYETMGMLLHFFITFLFVVFYFLVARQLPLLSKNWIIAGVIYGIAVCVFMNLVVVPSSGTPKFPLRTFPFIKSIVIQIFGTGLPITGAYAIYAGRKRPG